MKKCKTCDVTIYESEKFCPLCHNKMGRTKASIIEYPRYEDVIEAASSLRNIPLFITITGILICTFINIFTHDKGEILWSILTGASILYSFFMFKLLKSPHRRFGAKLVCSYILSCILVTIIDFSTYMLFWSTDIVFPFFTLGVIVYLTVLAIQNKRSFSEYFGYILVVTALSFISVILYSIGFYHRAWGSFVAILSCIIIATGLYLFADSTLKAEVKKRFYR